MPEFQTFKDLNITFKPHPVTEDLMIVKDENAIKQSIKTLLLTDKGERFFDPLLGTKLSRLLFEPLDYATASIIQDEIVTTISNYEKRVNITAIEVIPNFDSNGFDVELTYELIGRDDTPVIAEFFLERTR
jgi:phage baseplate assembly protein W